MAEYYGSVDDLPNYTWEPIPGQVISPAVCFSDIDLVLCSQIASWTVLGHAKSKMQTIWLNKTFKERLFVVEKLRQV